MEFRKAYTGLPSCLSPPTRGLSRMNLSEVQDSGVSLESKNENQGD